MSEPKQPFRPAHVPVLSADNGGISFSGESPRYQCGSPTEASPPTAGSEPSTYTYQEPSSAICLRFYPYLAVTVWKTVTRTGASMVLYLKTLPAPPLCDFFTKGSPTFQQWGSPFLFFVSKKTGSFPVFSCTNYSYCRIGITIYK